MVYQTIADDLIWLLLEAASLIPPGHPMAAETAYRKDQFTATFLPAMALKVLNRAEVNAAKKGCRKDRDYKFTGSSQRSKDDGFPKWFRVNVCTGKFEGKTLIGKWSLSLGRVEGGVWPDETVSLPRCLAASLPR